MEQDEFNSHCHDCLAPDPRWASVNNGLLLCINCAAGHRGFGVSVSKIRSLEYDNLEPEELAKLKLAGNQRFMELVNVYQLNLLGRQEVYFTKACQLYRETLDQCYSKGVLV